jgi:alpha-L-fucosidase
MIAFLDGSAQKRDSLSREWERMHASKKESIKKFNDAKFGMFIHFGVYSHLAGFWNGQKVKGIGECIMRYAEISRSDYRKAASTFNPEKFDADAWVLAAKNAGMRYIVAMPKHADGFAMYDSKVTQWDITDVTSFHRDPMAELYAACRKHGIRFSIYFNYLDWMDGGDGGVADYKKAHPADAALPGNDQNYAYWANTWDPSPVSFTDYFEKKYKPQLRELLTKFPGMQELWHDMPMKLTRKQSFEVYKMVYGLQPAILENTRVGNDFGDFFIPGDNIIPDDQLKVYEEGLTVGQVKKLPWETPGTMNNTWGFRSDDHSWKSTEELLYWLTDIASKGGNYLLNVGPTGEGAFPEESLKRLQEVGQWMKVNGESVYSTTKWTTPREGPTRLSMQGTEDRESKDFTAHFTAEDFWFTQKGKTVYATSLHWPEKPHVLIKSLAGVATSAHGKIASVQLLGSNEHLSWTVRPNGLEVALPNKHPDTHGYVLRIVFTDSKP